MVGLPKLGVGAMILAIAQQLLSIGSKGIAENILCFECWLQTLAGAVIGAVGVWLILNGYIEMKVAAGLKS